jgi:hydrogenase maturation protease HycI
MGAQQELFEQLSTLCGTHTVIVGIGNLLKGDDAAGPSVCQQLGQAGTSAELIVAETVPENYIQTIVRKAPQNLLIVDAVDFGATPGTIKLFKPEHLNSISISTHTLSPRLFIDAIRRQIEVKAYLIGIQPAQTQLGQPLSREVEQAIRKLSHVLVEIFPKNK